MSRQQTHNAPISALLHATYRHAGLRHRAVQQQGEHKRAIISIRSNLHAVELLGVANAKRQRVVLRRFAGGQQCEWLIRRQRLDFGRDLRVAQSGHIRGEEEVHEAHVRSGRQAHVDVVGDTSSIHLQVWRAIR